MAVTAYTNNTQLIATRSRPFVELCQVITGNLGSHYLKQTYKNQADVNWLHPKKPIIEQGQVTTGTGDAMLK